MVATSPRLFGSPQIRKEDPRLITGQATYVDDVRPAGLVHAVMLRSPHAHATIRSIDTSAAQAVPGVVAVYTGADLGASLGSLPCGFNLPNAGQVNPPHPAVAVDRVR